MDEEVAAKAASIFKRYRTAGGNVDHVEHITDRTEAIKVIDSLDVLCMVQESDVLYSVLVSTTPCPSFHGTRLRSILGNL